MKNKYDVGDKVIFKYLNKMRLGTIESVLGYKSIKNNKSMMYSIKGISPAISIREKSIIFHLEEKKAKPFFRIKL